MAYKCSISEIYMKQQKLVYTDTQPLTSAFPYTILAVIICDKAPWKDRFLCQSSVSSQIRGAELHFACSESWIMEMQTPCRELLVLSMCFDLCGIQQSETCKG